MSAYRRVNAAMLVGFTALALGMTAESSLARPAVPEAGIGPGDKRVVFLPDPAPAIRYEDGEGNTCVAEVRPRAESIADLVRINRHGHAYVLIAEQPAYLRITFAGGRSYQGPGQLNANVWIDPPSGEPRVFMAVGVARVSDGTSERLARCRGLVDRDGEARVLSIVVE